MSQFSSHQATPSEKNSRLPESLRSRLHDQRSCWLVTGVAGFIGSHLLEQLLLNGQKVLGIDNFITGSQGNLRAVQDSVGEELWKSFRFLEADICDSSALRAFLENSEQPDYILHQAALGSVPRSIDNPVASHRMNVTGFLEVLEIARHYKVKRLVYASSSSVYGDCDDHVKNETRIGNPLSPYAATKRCDEVYAEAFSRVYDLPLVGLRYFNVFGSRQDPDGPYAAVIPRWIQSLLENIPCQIFGDGKTSRDFCYILNVVQANILAALTGSPSRHEIFNVACGATTSLTELYETIELLLREKLGKASTPKVPAKYQDFRPGDIRNSLADITKASTLLGYQATHSVSEGLEETVASYLKEFMSRKVEA